MIQQPAEIGSKVVCRLQNLRDWGILTQSSSMWLTAVTSCWLTTVPIAE
jgi:hypothetical protein